MADLLDSLSDFSNRDVKPLLDGFRAEWAKLDSALKENKTAKYPKSAQTIEKILITLLVCLEDSPQKDLVKEILSDVVFVILFDERLSLDFSHLFCLRLRTLDLLLTLVDANEEECNKHFPQLLTLIMKFWKDMEDKQSRPQSTKPAARGGKGRGGRGARGGGKQSLDFFDELDDEESLYTEKNFTLPQLGVLLFNKSNQFLLLLAVIDKKLLGSVANTIWPSINKLLAVESVQIRMGVSELVAQLSMLSLPPAMIRVWEDLRKEEDKAELHPSDSKEDQEDSELFSSTAVGYKDDEEYLGYPFYAPTISFSYISETSSKLLALCDKYQDEIDIGITSVIGVLCAFVGQHYSMQEHAKFVGECLNFVVAHIEGLAPKMAIGKVEHFQALSYIVAFSLPESVVPHFRRLFQLIEGNEEATRRWARGEGAVRGAQGKAGRGRKGGRAAPAKAEVDPEDEKDYQILKVKLVQALALLCYKGSLQLLDYAERIFTTTMKNFDSNALSLDLMIALSQVVLTPQANNHPQKLYTEQNVAHHLPRIYNDAMEKVKNTFNLPAAKKESINLITKVSCAHVSATSDEPLFPNFLKASLILLLEALEKDVYQIGPTIIVSLQQVIMNNRTSAVLHEYLNYIIHAVAKYFAVEDKEQELLVFIKLAAFDTLALIFKHSEFKHLVSDATVVLAPTMLNVLKTSAVQAKEEADMLLKHDHDHDDDHECSSCEDDSDAPKKEKSPPPAALTKEELSNFKFDFGSSPSSEFKFDFAKSGGDASAPFKFDFGSAAPAAPFQFAFPSNTTTAAPSPFSLNTPAQQPVMASNPDGEAPAFTFGKGGGFKIDAEGEGTFNFADPKRGGKGGKGGRNAKGASPAPQEEHAEAGKGKKEAAKGKGTSIGGKKGKTMVFDEDDEDLGSDEAPELVDSEDMEDMDSYGDEEESLEYTQLCIAAIDTSISMLGLLVERDPSLTESLKMETMAALDVLGGIPEIESADLNKRRQKIEELTKKNV
eukprot:TRINITY_DN1428_c0_g1_i1.p1 TRINITY_DN1428_c0_g1~~TRINITY_DN1428_c0_g1_i1.p1  ORF type:complete len:999 (-),score=221.98 TRINITY_DN1428_c0_g1_i1:38-3034(-)